MDIIKLSAMKPQPCKNVLAWNDSQESWFIGWIDFQGQWHADQTFVDSNSSIVSALEFDEITHWAALPKKVKE